MGRTEPANHYYFQLPITISETGLGAHPLYQTKARYLPLLHSKALVPTADPTNLSTVKLRATAVVNRTHSWYPQSSVLGVRGHLKSISFGADMISDRLRRCDKHSRS
jgi:hypothetical protein